MVELDGCVVVDLRNTTDDSTIASRRLVLVPRGADIPREMLSDGATVVTVPLRSSVVYSSVHVAAIDEIGGIGAVTGIADASYVTTPAVVDGLRSGRVVDVGQSVQPSVEKMIELSPDLVLASPMTPVPQTAGVQSVDMADYLEATPLGRAEWLKLMGILYGRREIADSLFAAEEAAYNRLKELAAGATEHPKVLTEQFLSGVWYVPGGASYMARMLTDAGGVYPWADDTSAGSLPLDMATVLDRAGDADVWLLKSYGSEMTLDMLGADNSLNRRFNAFRTGNVWVADTKAVPLYEEFPFHPSRLLADMLYIFHPSLRPRLGATRYYNLAVER